MFGVRLPISGRARVRTRSSSEERPPLPPPLIGEAPLNYFIKFTRKDQTSILASGFKGTV